MIIACWGVTPSPEAARLHEEGVRLAQVGEYLAAATKLQQALELSPEFAEAAYALGQCYGALAELERAAELFRRAEALAQSPKLRLRATLAFGEVSLQRGDWEAARSAGERAVAMDRSNARAWTLLGDAQARLGDPEAAATAYQEGRSPDSRTGRSRSADWQRSSLSWDTLRRPFRQQSRPRRLTRSTRRRCF
ncbi:MAG: hypothetical protein KatS3mg115_1539 [Candidatus Poribacteria bacterium]|nr:MAG: hypothetical protein KatS3mg115_1539 [Candidatus Poribacteria bacterium]